jgi:hypothetical protein
MSDQFPKTTNFSAFASAANEASQADGESACSAYTSEERTVVALEMIGRQLALIHADLRLISDSMYGGRTSIGPPSDSSEDGQDRWYNEGGCFTEEGVLDPDLILTMEQHYAVGPYHYTNLQHATAQAERARRANKSSGADLAM